MGIFMLTLFFFWLILNGQITREIIIIGFTITFSIGYFAYKHTRLSIALEKLIFKKILYIIEYLIILVIEVIKANISMIKLVLSPSYKEIKPKLTYINVDLKTRLSRVALANSITLTPPGTITVAINENDYLIHAIDTSFIEGIEESIFVKKLKKIWRNNLC